MKTYISLMALVAAMAFFLVSQDAHAAVIVNAPNALGLSNGLVGWWSFDGKTIAGTHVYDASGNGNRGVMTNGPTLVNGKLGQGMQFDRSNDYVNTGSGATQEGEMTVMAWFKKNTNAASTFIFFSPPNRSFPILAWHNMTLWK